MNINPYLARIRREFPTLTFTKATLPCQGMDHVALILDEKWVFRFPKVSKYRKVFMQEAKLLEQLHRRLPLTIPCYRLIASDKSFGAYTLIQGKSLHRPTYKKCSERAKKKIQAQLADFLSSLHSFPIALAKKRGVAELYPKKIFREQLRLYRKFLRPALNRKEREYCDKYFLRRRNHLHDSYVPTFTHDDLYVDHILINDRRTGLAGIIDFGDRAISDPAIDFAGLWEYGEKFIKNVYAKYTGSKDPQVFERSRLLYIHCILSWLTHAVRGKWGTVNEPRKRLHEIMKMWPL